MLRAASLLATQPWSPGQKFREGLKKIIILAEFSITGVEGELLLPSMKIIVFSYLWEQTMPSSNVEAV